MRATAKWTVTAFAAVGALVLGGVPLAVVNAVRDRGDVAMVAFGMVIALLGVCWAIWQTSEALTPPLTTLSSLNDPRLQSLRRRLAEDPAAFFGGFGTDEQQLREALVLHQAVLDRLRRQVAEEQSGGRRLIWENALADARANVARAQYAQRRLLAFIHAWQVREALRRARFHTLGGVTVCVLGVLVFISAAVH
ncbi:hypothetical protein [Micromonospora sp. NPDC006431]|uniref:hypothetical protein n=1 Tax=Micromonospora sp. NPDC006431 TaxID=3364235 RepID=UPI00367AFEF9